MAVSLSLSSCILQHGRHNLEPEEVNWKHSHSFLKLSYPRVGFSFSRPNFLVLSSASSRSTGAPLVAKRLKILYIVNIFWREYTAIDKLNLQKESSMASEDTASSLDRVQVFDLNGKGIVISDLWKERKAVVAFARHFGCVLCRKRADYLAAEKDAMDAAGVALILIGPGSVDQANAFSEQTKFAGEVYADPTYSSYQALRFVSGVTTTFTPGSGLKIIQAYIQGYRQDWGLSFEQDTRTRGGWQQGGIIVAGPGKSNILYIHKDKEAGDDPDIKDVLQACC